MSVEAKNVLIVEDDTLLRGLLGEILAEASISYAEAGDGIEALKLIDQYQFHTLLCDINMPNMNGIELLKHLRVHCNQVPTVFLTATGDRTWILESLRIGALDFVTKPFNNEELVEVISRSVEIGKRLLRVSQVRTRYIPAKELEQVAVDEKMVSLLRVNNSKGRKK